MVIQKVVDKVVKIENFARYEVFIIVGILMALGVLAKLFWFPNISSDWFWFIAALGLIVEGSISLAKQRKFDKKYKIVMRDEFPQLNS